MPYGAFLGKKSFCMASEWYRNDIGMRLADFWRKRRRVIL